MLKHQVHHGFARVHEGSGCAKTQSELRETGKSHLVFHLCVGERTNPVVQTMVSAAFRLVWTYSRLLLNRVAGTRLRRLFISLTARALWFFNASEHPDIYLGLKICSASFNTDIVKINKASGPTGTAAPEVDSRRKDPPHVKCSSNTGVTSKMEASANSANYRGRY